ncbi:MAG: primosomal protein N' [Muribaculaceae bacterium]|nr:primosomal protein N' [Muribaculaceae bacterium]
MPQQYAEVILPLPLNATFTYRIPEDMVQRIKVGQRVIVQFGSKKFYTGIIESISPIAPEGYEVKDIVSILDDFSITKHPQLKLWHWISEYYLCSIGDVYKAAVPAGLKVESETFIELYKDFEEDEENRLSEREVIICQLLEHEGKLSTSDIEKKTGFKNSLNIINHLISIGAVIVSEKLIERYRSKKETYIKLMAEPGDSEGLHKAFDAVKGAKKQETLLLALIEMSGFTRKGAETLEVSRAQLLERTGVTTAIISALAKKGIIEVYKKESNRFQFSGVVTYKLPTLSEAQENALNSITDSFSEHAITLLHGVTSSGKTEIYIHLLSRILQQSKQALFLVPEIALTTQLTHRLQKVFGERVLIYHSRFSDNERVDIWKKLLTEDEPCVVIGARSSLFLPFSNLGIVIVDEEHESSYKQYDPAPRYNARDVAIVLASMHGAKTLLGSATPSIETYYKAKTGKFGFVELLTRYENVTLPQIETVDMTIARKRYLTNGSFAKPTIDAANEALNNKNQIIVFHNRRGFAPMARCKQCAWTPKCEHCDVSLTYHRFQNQLICHYCGASYPLPTICPACKEPAVEILGYGTERIEEEVANLFPEHKILRMDLDTTRNKDNYENIIEDFSNHKANILVGTQMVTKGLDFGGVSLVTVLNADRLINFPDFRSAERAYNMLEQVSGRAGRRNTQGKVIVQTSNPSHPIIDFLKNHDYTGFFNHEIEERKEFNYPPFTRVIYIYLKHRDNNTLSEIATIYASHLRQLFGNRVFGPEEPIISRIQSLYIRKIMLKVETNASMAKVKKILRNTYEQMHQLPRMKGMIVYYDVDPM